jgi:hypothetical protein
LDTLFSISTIMWYKSNGNYTSTLQSPYNITVVLIQWWYSDVTVVLQSVYQHCNNVQTV